MPQQPLRGGRYRAPDYLLAFLEPFDYAGLFAANPSSYGAIQPELDPESWVKDAAVVCTNPYEQFSEVMLELSTIELLGIQQIVNRYVDKPWQGYDPAVDAGVSNARFGYALRNQETQLIACYGEVRDRDPLAALASKRAEQPGHQDCSRP